MGDSQGFLKDDLNQLIQFLKKLLDSCADHDIFSDAPVSAADPRGYHEALAGIRDCIGRIRASGATREQMICILYEPGQSNPLSKEQTIDPGVLINLVLAEFTCEQEKLVFSLPARQYRACSVLLDKVAYMNQQLITQPKLIRHVQ